MPVDLSPSVRASLALAVEGLWSAYRALAEVAAESPDLHVVAVLANDTDEVRTSIEHLLKQEADVA